MNRSYSKIRIALGTFAVLVVVVILLQFNGSALHKPNHYDLPPQSDENIHGHDAQKKLIEENEVEIDGVHRHTKNTLNSEPNLLILVLSKDARSWGQNINQPLRTYNDFFQMIREMNLDPNAVSLGILTSDDQQYHELKKATSHAPFAKTSIYLHHGYANSTRLREDRHKDETQKERRREIARLRNYLLLRTLQDEAHIVWLDADIYRLSPDIVQTMISHSSRPDVGLITARCEIGDIPDYDGNAWAGPRVAPNAEELATLDAGGLFVARFGEGSKGMKDLIKDTPRTDLFHLDSVGATILYIRAALVHQGLMFPPGFIVGTTWAREGWDGIESEGICYLARFMGAGCFGMGGDWQVWHTDG